MATSQTFNVAALCFLLASGTYATGEVTYTSSFAMGENHTQVKSRSVRSSKSEDSFWFPTNSSQDRADSNQFQPYMREFIADEEKPKISELVAENTKVRPADKASSIDTRESIRTVFKTEAEELKEMSNRHSNVLYKLQLAVAAARGSEKISLAEKERRVRTAQGLERKAVIAKWRRQKVPKVFESLQQELKFMAMRHRDVLYELQLAIAASQGKQRTSLEHEERRARAAQTEERNAVNEKWTKIRHFRAREIGQEKLLDSAFGTGGVIATRGTMKLSEGVCIDKPFLNINDVNILARKSFGFHFTPQQPDCQKSKIIMSSSGPCCKREQLPKFEQLYDTGVALMALGATTNEAFATFIHARALAWTLKSCEPKLVSSQKTTFRRRKWQSPTIKTFGPKETRYLSVIAFPRSYETLYELYNTMLIERLRLRQNIRFPTPLIMDKLYYRFESRRNAATIKILNFDMTSSNFEFFPRKIELNKIVTSARILTNIDNAYDFKLSGRQSRGRYCIVHESSSRSNQRVDDEMCNAYVRPSQYFVRDPGTTVRHRYEACCATECRFVAKYSRMFSISDENCCRGCNRYSCPANSKSTVSFLGWKSTITTPKKSGSSPMMISFLV